MRNRTVVIGICALALIGIGAAPRYLEELRIGGGYGDAADGGADFDKSGNIATDGSVKATGEMEAGKDSTSRGLVTAWDGAGTNAPGTLKLGSTDGTVGYVFMSNDRSGLRISSSLPTSDTDGNWLKAKTVTDLSSPPAIGGTTPAAGKFTTLEATGAVTVGGTAIQLGPNSASTSTVVDLGGGSSYPSTLNAAHWSSFAGANGGAGIVGSNVYFTTSGAAAQHYTHASLGYAGIGFLSGTTTVYGATGATTANSSLTGLATIDPSKAAFGGYLTTVGGVHVGGTSDPGTDNLLVDGTGTFTGGDLTCGVGSQTRGVLTAHHGASGNTPGVLKLASPNGTVHCFFAEDDGTLKVHSALPGSNSDGIEVGSQFSSMVTTFTANDTTPSISGGRLFRVPGTWTTGNNITMFDSAVAGQEIVVIGGDSDCVVVDGGHLALAGNWTAAAGKTLRLVFDGTDWYETSRADN
jgi:hypothetical protein